MPVHVTWHGAVLELALDRPERRNAVDHETLVALHAAQQQAADARAVVLTGRNGVFCAGADLTGVEGDEFAAALRRVLQGFGAMPVATIAAVDGPALGAGSQLALACDLRVATPRTRFGVPASKLGLMIDAWTVQRLAALVGGSVARAVLIAAEELDGARAHALGFVHRLGDLGEALAWAAHIAQLAPLSVAGHKLALERFTPVPDDPDVRAMMARVWASDDAREGRTAFLEKRPPRFTGT
jgi:enoyl-CoA hydratase